MSESKLREALAVLVMRLNDDLAVNAEALRWTRERGDLLEARDAAEAALSSPASPGPEPRGMEPDYDVIEAAYLRDEDDGSFRRAMLAAFRQGQRAPGAASPGERRECCCKDILRAGSTCASCGYVAPAAPPEWSPDDAARWVKALKQVGLPVPPGFEKAMRAAPPESSGAEKEEP